MSAIDRIRVDASNAAEFLAAGAAAVGAGSTLDDPGQARRLVEAVRRSS